MRAIATIIVLAECCQITKTANNYKYWDKNCQARCIANDKLIM